MNNQYNEETKVENGSGDSEGEYVYKTVIKSKENRRTLSVASLGLSILSILTVMVSWLSLIFGLLSVGAGIISRKNLGYFDKLTLAGIIIGIFGFVFSIVGIIFGGFISAIL